jgi:PBSX family phage portal protein
MDTSNMRVSRDDTPDDPNEIDVVLPSATSGGPGAVERISKVRQDPFAKSLDKIRELDGLNPSFKRKVTRQLNKSITASGAGADKPLATGEGNARSKMRTDKFATGYGAFDVVEPPYNLDYLAKLYEISPAHMAAVDAKVTNIVGLGYYFKESHRTLDKLSRINNEPALERARARIDRAKIAMEEWVDRTNSKESFLEVLRMVMTDLETTGNGYFEISRITKGPLKGQIGYIGHAHSTTIRRRVNMDGYVQLVAGRATFFRNYGDTRTADPIGNDASPNEIIHLSKYTPTNSYYGVPDVLSARNAVAGEEFASRFNLDYFEHKAVPRYIVVLKNAKLSLDAEQRLVDFLQNGLKGQHHRTMYVPLPADSEGKPVEFKLEPVEASITDASFTKYHDMNRDDVLMAHRVPLPQVGFTGNISMGASRDSARMFKEQVCRPWQAIIERRLRPLFSEVTDAFEMHLVELTLTDEETASRIHERYLRWEVETPNEIREWLGKKGRKGGDTPTGVMQQIKEKARTQKQAGMGPDGQQANATRTRDAERSGGPDGAQSDRTRNSQGEGRQTE